MQLYEQGKFLLEDEISLYFPVLKNLKVKTESGELVDAKTPITVRDLFCMTAGIGDGDDYAETGMQFFVETGGACPIMELPTYLARRPFGWGGYCVGNILNFHPDVMAVVSVSGFDSSAALLKQYCKEHMGKAVALLMPR